MGRKYQIEIKILTTYEELNKCNEISKEAWLLSNYRDCVPSHILIAISEIGGVVIGALHRKKLVGFAFSLPAYSETEGFYHHSHQMGVLPKYQGKGIGYLIKMKQREYALEKKVKKITWTFDPLQAQNAKLNIAKIGGIARKYKVDVYGSFMGGSGLVSGMPSDRFLLEWHIASKNVVQRLSKQNRKNKFELRDFEKYKVTNSIENSKSGLQKISNIKLGLEDNVILMELPENFQYLYNRSIKLAKEWRLKTRNIFNYYLGKGYVVKEFISVQNGNNFRNFYLMDKTYTVE